MKFILGKKIEMSQLFNEQGDVVPVTVIEAGPCLITQVKNAEKDGYSAVQLGFGKKKRLTKALRGHLKGLSDFRWVREFRIKNHESRIMNQELKRGDKIIAGVFEIGDVVKITGTSKGKGFQGVVKRHGFHGGPASHGHKDQLRMPGSIGASEPARVFKGKRMAGHMGAERVTVKNLEIVKIDKEKNLLYIKGAVPGSRNSLVMICGEGELKINQQKTNNKKQNKGNKETGNKLEIKGEGNLKIQENKNIKIEEKEEEIKDIKGNKEK